MEILALGASRRKLAGLVLPTPPPPCPNILSSGRVALLVAQRKLELKMMLTLSVRSSVGMMMFMSGADTWGEKRKRKAERGGKNALTPCSAGIIQ